MDAIIIEASTTDLEQRRLVFGLLGERLKQGITRLPNGRWEAVARFGLADELKAYSRTRRDAETAIDKLMEIIADPAQAIEIYRYFRSLAARAETGGLEIAGDLFRSDGVFNADAKATDQ